LVLHHGFTGSGQDWVDDGCVEMLEDNFEVLLLDARGHGRSDKPTDPAAYAMDLRARDVVAVLDDASLATAHFLGYSMGGRVGWALGIYTPERFVSLLIGGSGPSPDPPETIDLWIGWLRDGGVEGVIQGMEELWGPLPESFKVVIRTNDTSALLAERLASREEPSLVAALPSMTTPCLVFVGSEDPRHADAKTAAERLPHATFVSLAGLNHLQAAEYKHLIPVVMNFLTEQIGVH